MAQNPVYATQKIENKVDPLMVIFVSLAGVLWKAIIGDEILANVAMPFLANLAVKQLAGFYLSYFVLLMVYVSWGEEPRTDLRIILCNFALLQMQKGRKNKLYLSLYSSMYESVSRDGVLPPGIKESFIP